MPVADLPDVEIESGSGDLLAKLVHCERRTQ
jgi:hypothetical protein